MITLSSYQHTTHSYSQALQSIEYLRMQEPDGMNPDGKLQLMTHGEKVSRVIILVHGFTSCPRQFTDLGQRFHNLGYNVLIVPLPYHGLADRMTIAHGLLKADQLSAYADQTVDVAQGLGKQVVMMGLSAGGIITAFAAQTRSDLALAVVISPAFGAKLIPKSLTAVVANVALLLPDMFIWWDPQLKENVPPPYAYPRFSTHGLAQIMRLGFAVQKMAKHKPPAAKRLVIVLNANDPSVNNSITMDVVKLWQAHGTDVTTYEFEADLKLGHDLIDPNQPDQQVDIVYPRLIELVNH